VGEKRFERLFFNQKIGVLEYYMDKEIGCYLMGFADFPIRKIIKQILGDFLLGVWHFYLDLGNNV